MFCCDCYCYLLLLFQDHAACRHIVNELTSWDVLLVAIVALHVLLVAIVVLIACCDCCIARFACCGYCIDYYVDAVAGHLL